MSIQSDKSISLEDAKKLAKKVLMIQQENLIDSAIKAMESYEISAIINRDAYSIYYDIEENDEES